MGIGMVRRGGGVGGDSRRVGGGSALAGDIDLSDGESGKTIAGGEEAGEAGAFLVRRKRERSIVAR